MKKIIKYLVIIIISIIMVVVSAWFFYYYRLSNQWKDYWTKEEIIQFSNQINSVKSMTDDFYFVFDSIYPNYRTRSMFLWYLNTSVEISGLTDVQFNQCPCNLVKNLFKNNKDKMVNSSEIVFGFGVSKYSSPEKCYDYFLINNIFYSKGLPVKGIDNACDSLFNKKIENLNKKELIKLAQFVTFK